MIIFPGSQVLDFSGNSHTQKINKTQTKRANITGFLHNSQGWTGSGVKFVLSFLLVFICDNYQPFYLSIAASRYYSCHGLSLTHYVQYTVQYIVAVDVIPHTINWEGCLQDMWAKSSKPPLLFWQMRHCQCFPSQYSVYFSLASLLTPSSSSHISADVLSLRRLHNNKYLFLSSSYLFLILYPISLLLSQRLRELPFYLCSVG